MPKTALISVTGEDRLGLIAELTARIFDLGGDLGDTTFAVLGTAFEFSTVVEFPDQTVLDEIGQELKTLPLLSEASFDIQPFRYDTTHSDSGRITHRIRISGGDQPGLVARLSEVFVSFDANVVRMNCETTEGRDGIQNYITRFAVSIPPERAAACLAAIGNTAGQLELIFTWDEAWEARARK
jgi:glycine cleavage system transcriptional repressor